MRGRGPRVALALIVTALVAPSAAEARGNCCFELAVDNKTTYLVNYLEDGLGYDGTYSYEQSWYVRAIVSSRRSRDNPVRVRDSFSIVVLFESTAVTRCKDSSRPCPDNREPIECTGSDGSGKFQFSEYGRGGGVSVSRDQLYALPPDDVYYSVDQLGCDGGHGHPGYGEKAEGIAGDRSVKLKPPGHDFLRTAGPADRCSHVFSSSLSQGPDHVGSEPGSPHTTNTSVNSSYYLSHFPRSKLRKQRAQLPELSDFPEDFLDWGEDGTGNQRC